MNLKTREEKVSFVPINAGTFIGCVDILEQKGKEYETQKSKNISRFTC